MKIAIIGVLAVLLLGGGAAGAYFYFGKPAEAASTEAAEHAKVEKPAEGEDGHAPANGVEFVSLDAIILPIVDERGVSQVVTLVISLEVPDAGAAADARTLSPRLKDAIIQDMYGVLSRKAVLKGGVLEVGKIKARLNEISARILGKENVNDVLLQVVNQRRV
ncbi:MAG: flagellar basal body-associated FliL family protein [Alphaproteobacteria bacterium]|nr:flagellar basal body-associated FliL family protein [Alphaproteobacteria bacterium]